VETLTNKVHPATFRMRKTLIKRRLVFIAMLLGDLLA